MNENVKQNLESKIEFTIRDLSERCKVTLKELVDIFKLDNTIVFKPEIEVSKSLRRNDRIKLSTVGFVIEKLNSSSSFISIITRYELESVYGKDYEISFRKDLIDITEKMISGDESIDE